MSLEERIQRNKYKLLFIFGTIIMFEIWNFCVVQPKGFRSAIIPNIQRYAIKYDEVISRQNSIINKQNLLDKKIKYLFQEMKNGE